MKRSSPSQLERATELFRACSDPLRLRILHLLQAGEACVGDLALALEVAQPTASRHLGALKRAGLVLCREDGTWRHYRLAPGTDETQRRLRACLRACFAEGSEFAADRARLEGLGGCC